MRVRVVSFLLFASAPVFVSCAGEPSSIEAAAKIAGCGVEEYANSQNIFNGQSAKCVGGGRVYWFPTKEANRNHAELCANFGAKKVAGGATWTRYNPSC